MNKIQIPGHPNLFAIIPDHKKISEYSDLIRRAYLPEAEFLTKLLKSAGIEVVQKPIEGEEDS